MVSVRDAARRLTLIGLLLLLGTVPSKADPSFDCTRAQTADEQAICADDTLSFIDRMIASAFQSFTPAYQTKTKVARDLLRDRAGCSGDRLCIVIAQWNTLAAFGQYPQWVRHLALSSLALNAERVASSPDSRSPPTEVGQCVRTSIAKITTRFGDAITYDNADAGTVIAYTNGTVVVTYGRDYAYAEKKPGEPVAVCLMSIPHDCPDGDDRGREYYTLDLKTNAEWVLPDAQHACGGA